jgi:hypothetical protein
MTIARDASNPQKRKVIATGTAFCTEKIATRNNTINNIIIVAMNISSILPNISRIAFLGKHTGIRLLQKSPTIGAISRVGPFHARLHSFC